jgi:hypothetical protein
MGSRVGMDVFEMRKSLASAGIRNPGHPAYYLVTITTTETVPKEIRLCELFVVLILYKNIQPNSNIWLVVVGEGVLNSSRKGDIILKFT